MRCCPCLSVPPLPVSISRDGEVPCPVTYSPAPGRAEAAINGEFPVPVGTVQPGAAGGMAGPLVRCCLRAGDGCRSARSGFQPACWQWGVRSDWGAGKVTAPSCKQPSRREALYRILGTCESRRRSGSGVVSRQSRLPLPGTEPSAVLVSSRPASPERWSGGGKGLQGNAFACWCDQRSGTSHSCPGWTVPASQTPPAFLPLVGGCPQARAA